MRLMDRIAEVRSATSQPDAGISHHDSLALAGCALRYVMTKEASAQCGDLIRSSPELLTAKDDLLRLPAEQFWVEWFAEMGGDGDFGGDWAQKIGCLVQTNEGGRSGHIILYGTTFNGGVDRLPGKIIFDLDHRYVSPYPSGSYRMSHGDLGFLNNILSHALMQLEERWRGRAKLDKRYAYQDLVRHQAEQSWYALPFILAFAALLNSDDVVDQTPSQLAQLNASRARRRRRALLEHVEVSMRLGERRQSDGAAQDNHHGARATARLHFVRGHTVSRGGKTFWRTSHLRGDADAPIISKTVSVRGGSEFTKRFASRR